MAPLVNPDESVEAFRRRLDGVAYATYFIVMLVVPLKVWCRKKAGGWGNVGLDDWATLIALGVANAFFYVCIIDMRKSLGLHITTIQDPFQIMAFLKNIYVANMLYTCSITAIKLSILGFYWRLFSLKARVVIYVTLGMVLAWWIAIMVLCIWNCDPVRAAWDITITNAKCIETRAIYLGGSVPNVILDSWIVLIPLPYVWKLHAPIGQRLLLAGMFALGIFICVVSLVRLIIFLNIPITTAGDVTYNFREIIVWSIVEVNIGLTCACLPSLKPALAMLGLNKLFFSLNNSRPSNAKTPEPGLSEGLGSEGSRRPRKKGSTGGMFSSLAGLTKLGSEEDGFTIMDNESERARQGTNIELTRISNDSDSQRSRSNARHGGGVSGMNGITVQKDWSVLVDEKRDNRH
ncbi:hypothetical protein DM02DRAFT_197254 [Periconia macrospinosa]|uniref:Rhodopsin domain-containing protein n=1 Tax=Periconia macrospinosa TaxID=97972 RepID=A0A2V1D810_9PLEO|nr:hypothetical protein DM02DRAFT_197254 [Periconia macrospinosa]